MKSRIGNFWAGIGIGIIAGSILKSIKALRNAKKDMNKRDRDILYYTILNKWLELKIEGRSIYDALNLSLYKKAAIYGAGELGNRLYEDLRNTDIEISYVIDKVENYFADNIEVVAPENVHLQNSVDIINVTPVHDLDEIYKILQAQVDCEIVPLTDMV